MIFLIFKHGNLIMDIPQVRITSKISITFKHYSVTDMQILFLQLLKTKVVAHTTV